MITARASKMLSTTGTKSSNMDISIIDSKKEKEQTFETLNNLLLNMEKEQAHFAANLILYIGQIYKDILRR